MKVHIKEHEGKNIRLAVPTGMLLNRLTAGIAKRYIVKYDKSDNVNIRAKDINRLFAEIKKFKRKHPDLSLVEVEGKDGDRVYIKL